MKVVKYICFAFGGLLALSNIGGMLHGLYTPLLWILMIVFFWAGVAIKDVKK